MASESPVKKKAAPTPSGREKSDDRVERSKAAVLAATYELLSEVGLAGASVDEISKRCGVAKTTIYRHWPSRAKLLLDACSKLSTEFPAPETGTLRGDLTALATAIAQRLESNFATILPSILDAAERDPEIAVIFAQLHAGVLAPVLAVIEGAQQRGELPRKQRAGHLVARIVGPLFYRRWFAREPVDVEFVRSVVENALTGAVDNS
jgi:AcrR family transcriptional regulator